VKKSHIILIAGVLMLAIAANKNIDYTLAIILGGLGVVLTIVGTVLTIRDRHRDLAAARAADEQIRMKRAADEMMRKEAEKQAQAAAAARRAEWERTHGRIVTALAGVTFNNDDGTSRQKLLKDLKARGDEAEVELEEFEYKGKPAVRVLIDGDCVGNIPRTRVEEVLAAMELGITAARIDIETFRPEEEEDEEGNIKQRGELIYRADLTLIYDKS